MLQARRLVGGAIRRIKKSARRRSGGRGGETMKITFEAEPKEIAALVLEIQGQHSECELDAKELVKAIQSSKSKQFTKTL